MLPFSDAVPLTAGQIRVQDEDFSVEEIMPVTPCGEGEHIWLQLRKRGMNTNYLANLLARAAGVHQRDVGVAGLKDRHAITTQWFSVYQPKPIDVNWHAVLPAEVEVLSVARHERKLRRGSLKGNRFEIRVRDIDGDMELLERRLTSIAAEGVPNYFGEQRFGHHGGNLDKAVAMFAGKYRPRDRKTRGLYLSAARSFLFNRILAIRVEQDNWNRALSGDAFQLAGSQSFFVQDIIDDDTRARITSHDIHPTGALWGRGAAIPRAEALELENHCLKAYADLRAGLEMAGLEQARRALRLDVGELCWDIDTDARVVMLRFVLPSGTYATTVLREVVDYTETQPDRAQSARNST